MYYFILMILLGISIITPLGYKTTQKYSIHKKGDIKELNINQEDNMQDSFFKVEGTIKKVTFFDTSKTSRVKSLVMDLYLTTSDSLHEDIVFFKRPVLESDKQLRVGQRVSITARKTIISESLEIVNIEPL